MLVIQDLHKSYDTGKSKLHVLKGINLNISEGEFVSIMGSSGSGNPLFLILLVFWMKKIPELMSWMEFLLNICLK
jgi:ABC-type lipoprotein export system ATPase subunit